MNFDKMSIALRVLHALKNADAAPASDSDVDLLRSWVDQTDQHASAAELARLVIQEQLPPFRLPLDRERPRAMKMRA